VTPVEKEGLTIRKPLPSATKQIGKVLQQEKQTHLLSQGGGLFAELPGEEGNVRPLEETARKSS